MRSTTRISSRLDTYDKFEISRQKMMRRLISAFAIAFAIRAHAQHPITFEDLAAIHRVGAPQISPDGKTIAYDASTPDLAANTSNSAVMLVPASECESR